MFLDYFVLPTMDEEEALASKKMKENIGVSQYAKVSGYLDNGYPCGIFTKNELTRLDFEKITILYGGNGSGKTTLLNIIANKLKLKRIAPFNDSELFSRFVDACSFECGFNDFGEKEIIPPKSQVITSDDVFEYMLTLRQNNEEIEESKDYAKEEWAKNRYGKTVQVNSLDDYEELRVQLLARRKSVSRRKFMQQMIGKESKLNSNGETAIRYFDENIKPNSLYCLDEPENSLSAPRQQELTKLLEYKVRCENCQVIIATHSPFVLAMEKAKIYDIDSTPVDIKKWYELDNVKVFYEFFKKYNKLFEKS